MWESERTIDVHESSLHKAEIINRKSLKRIKHVNGKYVVVQTYDENGPFKKVLVLNEKFIVIIQIRKN